MKSPFLDNDELEVENQEDSVKFLILKCQKTERQLTFEKEAATLPANPIYRSGGFPSGEYYIGDLSYVLSGYEWCTLANKVYPVPEAKGIFGKHQLLGKSVSIYKTVKEVSSFAGYNTKDDEHYRFSVDSGSIGIIAVSDINTHNPVASKTINYGHIIKFDESFKVEINARGMMTAGHLKINTGNSQAVLIE